MAVHSGAVPQKNGQLILAQDVTGGEFSELPPLPGWSPQQFQPTPIQMPQSSKHGAWGEWAKSVYGWTDKDLNIADACLKASGQGKISLLSVPGGKGTVRTPPTVASALIYGSHLGTKGGCALRKELAKGVIVPIKLGPIIGIGGATLNEAVPANGQDGTSIAPPAAPPSQPTPEDTAVQEATAVAAEKAGKINPLIIGAGAALIGVLLLRGMIK
jgi:hypothetical protein